MPLHKTVQDLLLLGAPSHDAPAPTPVEPPPALKTLVDELEQARKERDERAIEFGHRYRSAFWGLYLLSALAILFAVLPVSLEWDQLMHDRPHLHWLHHLWGYAELVVLLTIVAVYLLGLKQGWKDQWLSARLQAELIRYMPLAATLIPAEAFSAKAWAAIICGGAENSADVNPVQALCTNYEAVAREAAKGAQADSAAWARWMSFVVAGQQHYHARTAHRQHQLQHRVHGINLILFILTIASVVAHLYAAHPLLLLATTVFPALGAALHGALAQSEAYRLEANSKHLAVRLRALQSAIDAPETVVTRLPQLGKSALDLILSEHHGWHHVVRPHNLPLG